MAAQQGGIEVVSGPHPGYQSFKKGPTWLVPIGQLVFVSCDVMYIYGLIHVYCMFACVIRHLVPLVADFPCGLSRQGPRHVYELQVITMGKYCKVPHRGLPAALQVTKHTA